MNKKISWYICIALCVLLICQSVGIYFITHSDNHIKQHNVALEDFLADNDGYRTENLANGYIGDASTAAKVGGAIIDSYCESYGQAVPAIARGAVGTEVDYDSNLRLWRVTKGYINHGGAVVVIEQDTGKVILSYLQK